MEFLSPATWREALAARHEHPGAAAIMGGTDVMVELNFDRRRPETLIDLTRIAELRAWAHDGDRLRLGAGLSYTAVIEDLGGLSPALAKAARTVASPQIRNRGTVGGNLGAGSPAGDCHPPLLALRAEIEVESVRGLRRIAADDFYLGPKKVDLAPDELIRAIVLPRAAGAQQFAKVGPRNAMVIAVCSFSLALDAPSRRVGTGIGSAGPTPLRAAAAEEFLAAEFDWAGGRTPAQAALARFGELVAAAAAPIDDVRGSAAYRRHALAVLARRCAQWAAEDHRKGAAVCG